MVGRPQKHLVTLEPSLRHVFSFTVLALFVVFFFSNSLSDYYGHLSPAKRKPKKFPDFSHSRNFWTLSPQEFPLDDPSRRVLILGDIHGMYEPLQKLLAKVSYDPSSDVLVMAGDFLTKGPHVGSMQTLSFMASNNITAVRGNHDQMVIEWRAWIHWINSQPGGPRWLEETLTEWNNEDNEDLEDWFDNKKRKNKDDEWWQKIPNGWTLFDSHFTVAQDMSEAQFAYLRNLPYVIHIPSAHAFIVHAGLLASDPKLSHKDSRQPLARMPQLSRCCNHKPKDGLNTTQILREIQEREILTEIPQNTVYQNVINIRSIIDRKVSKTADGKPWSKAWKQDMQRCTGFHGELSNVPTAKKKRGLPCYPMTVLYGHAAGRGLDVKRWSIGLDTGCVYERRLTALVLGGKNAMPKHRDDDDDDEEQTEIDILDDDDSGSKIKVDANQVRFGDSHHGQIVSVKCP